MHYRVIPTLLLKDSGLVKTTKFKDSKYIGDPINAVKIFNDKEVDELLFLDISATPENREPQYDLIQDISSEAFMPFGYGGGVNKLEQVEKLFRLGVEKVVFTTAFYKNPEVLRKASDIFGAQAIVVSLDVKKGLFKGYETYHTGGKVGSGMTPEEAAKKAEQLGVGEIIVNSIDLDGTMQGYDLELIRKVSSAVRLPVVASGGAGSLKDFKSAIDAKASAVSAGAFFVFHGKHKAVLITYPTQNELKAALL